MEFKEMKYRMRRFLKITSVVIVTVTLTACGSFLSGAGPYKGDVLDGAGSEAYPYQLVEISPSNISNFMRPPPTALVPSVAKVRTFSTRLVPGDVVKVMIADNVAEGAMFAPLASGGTVFERVRVDSDGRISIPYAGRPSVVGMSLTDVEDTITRNLRGLVGEPQVHVELVSDYAGSVLVAGAVRAPGRFSALDGPMTVLDAVNMAGGPVLEPHLVNVVLRFEGGVQSIPYQELLNGKNISLSGSSEIIVERARKRFVAMGAVNDPGLHDLPSEQASLLEVLGVVGGLKEANADARGVFVFRFDDQNPSEESAQVFRLDMREPAAIFLARKFLMRPEDAVYVTNAAVYEWQKIVSPIVQTLILGRTVSGF